MPDNYHRLIQLAEEVFAFRNDPEQLNVNEEVIERLHRIHPSTLMEQRDKDGPVAWVLIIPTTIELMNRFLEKRISERQLFNFTNENVVYEAIYLCSALVLEEYQRKGITTDLLLKAIANIRESHPIRALFVWPFTKPGEAAADKIAGLTHLPLYKR
ncbi:MAG TPA: hypothetical protein VHI78_01520 [Bacteroidales bacterium]|jgi:GNAT superfamily N-acetyltransferase|nr:hypothetical protein [Bacteroidales bacterium]